VLLLRLAGCVGVSKAGKKTCQDGAQKGARTCQPGKPFVQQQAGEVGRILVERKLVLVVPIKSDALMTDQPERFDGQFATTDDRHPVAEGLAGTVARRRPIRAKRQRRQDDVLAWQGDDAAAERGERNVVGGDRKVERTVLKLSGIVAVEFGFAQVECVDLAAEETELRA
jgi:hypothetical protein